jgi:hypothetical protein
MQLEVCAGLANRIRATVSGLCAAEDLSENLLLSWPLEFSFGAAWDDLFYPINATITRTPLQSPKMCLNKADWSSQHPPIKIKSYGQFHRTDQPRWLDRLRALRPKEIYLERVRYLFRGVRPVGVHIRRTDNVHSILNSPTASFIKEMRKLPEALFFIATDDKKELQILSDEFPWRILSQSTHFNRHTLEGIQEAFIDFLALSQCSQILGSAASSFSEIAAAYGGIPLHVCSF